MNDDHYVKWSIGSTEKEKINMSPPKKFEFLYQGFSVQQPLLSPNGKYALLAIGDKNKDFYYDFTSLDAFMNIETGQSLPISIRYTEKIKQGKFLPIPYIYREWLTDSTIVYSFGIDEYLHVVNIHSGEIKLFDGRSKYQTKNISPQVNKSPSQDENAEYAKYNDYYPRMFSNRLRGEIYRIYKKVLPEKNEKREFNTRANMEYSIIVFDMQLNKKCEIDMPSSERYVSRLVPSPGGFFYNMFVNPRDSASHDKFMEVTFY